ncbi:Protein recA, partial [Candidatus Arthromitus sp. SFB-5]
MKNKVAPPFRISEFDIIYNRGISKEGSLLDLAVKENIIQKSGSWFSYKNEKLGQGRENAKQFLLENKSILQEIERLILEKYNIEKSGTSKETKDDVNCLEMNTNNDNITV